jgi:outer membrane protein TolC
MLPHAVCGGTSSPPPIQPIRLTLADCVTAALKGNRSVQRAYLTRVAQQMDLRVARNEFVPQGVIDATATANATRQTDPASTTREQAVELLITQAVPTGGTFSLGWTGSSANLPGVERQNDASWRLSLAQPLLRGGGTTVGTATLYLAQLSERGNVLSLRGALQDAVTSVIVSFRSLIVAEREVGIRRAALDRGRQLIEINKALIAAGRMAEVEQVQAEADIANLELSVLTAENSLEAARLSLLQLLTWNLATPLEPVEELGEGPPPPTIDAAVELARANRPDYIQATLAVEADERSLAVARNNLLPDLGLELSMSRSSSGATWSGVTAGDFWGTSRANWFGGLRLAIPVNDPTRQQGFLHARIALEQAKLDLADRRDALDTEVRNAVRNAEVALRQLKIAKQGRVLSERKLEIEQEKLRTGRSSNFQVVNFQNDLVNSQSQEIGATVSYLNALTYLDRTLGTTLVTWGIEVHEADTVPPVPRPGAPPQGSAPAAAPAAAGH